MSGDVIPILGLAVIFGGFSAAVSIYFYVQLKRSGDRKGDPARGFSVIFGGLALAVVMLAIVALLLPPNVP